MAYKYSHGNVERKIFNILIADDDIDVATGLGDYLKLRGHNITIVDDGIRCVSHCKDSSRIYDIVFLDYHMQDLDGTQVAEIVKESKSNTLIFAYTGDNSESAISEFKNVGMSGVIIKPTDTKGIDALLTSLERSIKLDESTIKSISRKSNRSVIIFQ